MKQRCSICGTTEGFPKVDHRCVSCRRSYYSKRTKAKQDLVHPLLEAGCRCCGEGDMRLLDFHHLCPERKRENISQLVFGCSSQERLLRELAKCVVLCVSCHRIVHHKDSSRDEP